MTEAGTTGADRDGRRGGALAESLAPPRATVPADWRPEAVYAIRYATRPTAVRGEHFYGHSECDEDPMPIDYYVWLVVGPDAGVLLDAGFTPETAAARPGRIHLGSPLEVMDALGVPPGTVGSVVLSHGHYDHTGYLGQFPHARVHVQQREMAFWVGPHARRATYRDIVHHDDVVELVRANFAGRVDQYDGDVVLAPGVSAHLVAGHTVGMQVLRVETTDGRVVVLASDASHFYANAEADRPFSIVHTLPAMYDAFDRLEELSWSRTGRRGVVVPGHDPLVMERFSGVFPDGHPLAERVRQLA